MIAERECSHAGCGRELCRSELLPLDENVFGMTIDKIGSAHERWSPATSLDPDIVLVAALHLRIAGNTSTAYLVVMAAVTTSLHPTTAQRNLEEVRDDERDHLQKVISP